MGRLLLWDQRFDATKKLCLRVDGSRESMDRNSLWMFARIVCLESLDVLIIEKWVGSFMKKFRSLLWYNIGHSKNRWPMFLSRGDIARFLIREI